MAGRALPPAARWETRTIQVYILRRLLLLIPTLVGLSLFIFFAVRFLPGDVVDQMLSDFGPSDPTYRAVLEERFNLNGNLPKQYVQWVGEVLRGDFGESFFSNREISDALRHRLPVTFQLGAMAMVLSALVAVPIGVFSAIWQDSYLDYVLRSFAVALIALPSFWLGLIAIVFGFQWFGWVPPIRFEYIWDDPLVNFQILWVPTLILAGALSGSVMRYTRSTMLEVLRQDYVRTARAKGLSERSVIIKHSLRNAVLPVITAIGLQTGILIGGTVVLETIFSLPGIGTYLFDAINGRDYPVVQAVTLLVAAVVIFVNVMVDLSYALIDPRIKYN